MIKASEMINLHKRGEVVRDVKQTLNRLTSSPVEPKLLDFKLRGDRMTAYIADHLPPHIRSAIVALALQGLQQFVETETKALADLGIDPDA